jgi:hypothetical protein
MTEAIRQLLFGDEELTAFAILDGASVPDLLESMHEHAPEQLCLYRGALAPDLAEVAPYLARLQPDTEFTDWVLDSGWGHHWGIFLTTRVAPAVVHRHLRRFLIVHDPDGKPLYFRYYDPRVLRVYLPTCNAEELAAVFGPVEAYVVEDADPGVALRFTAVEGGLKTERRSVAA